MDNDELLLVIKDMFEKKTDELKDLFEKKTDEFKTYVDEKINGQSILIESLRDDIKTVAEEHDFINCKISDLDKKADDRMNELKTDIKVIADYVIGVDAKLNEHEVILKRVK